MNDRLCQWIANHLPERIVYFCAIRLMVYATTGEWSATVTPELTGIEALKRWGVQP